MTFTATPATPYLPELMDTAWELGTTGHGAVDPDTTPGAIAAAVTSYHAAADLDDGSPLCGFHLSDPQVVAIAQTYFDGLAHRYGLRPGEVVVHAAPASQGGPWARMRR